MSLISNIEYEHIYGAVYKITISGFADSGSIVFVESLGDAVGDVSVGENGEWSLYA